MIRASQLAERGEPDGMVVVADFQTAGRGTRGRIWRAPPGSCLMFTIAGRPNLRLDELANLPLKVGASIAGALCSFLDLVCEVDPPNDVTVNGRKLCGILCNARIQGGRIEWVLCGVGLNTAMTPDQLPVADATSLLVECGETPNHSDLLERLLTDLEYLHGSATDGAE